MIGFNDLTLESQRIARLESELAEARDEIRRLKDRARRYRQALGIRQPVNKTAILALMEKGLRNCEIVAKGHNPCAVKRARKQFKEATGHATNT